MGTSFVPTPQWPDAGEKLIETAIGASLHRGPRLGPIGEAIAHQVGQKDAAFFSRRLRRKVNLSPARYRKWEQGRTRPTGPARALLRIVEKDPKAMLTLHAA